MYKRWGASVVAVESLQFSDSCDVDQLYKSLEWNDKPIIILSNHVEQDPWR